MKLPKKYGEVYIGVIIALAILLIISQAVVSLIFAAYDLITYTRARTTARFLAEQKIETIKNISYEDIGTVGGIPNGILEPTETIVVNSLPYQVETRVDNIDDPFDGSGESDENPADYKKISVTINWGGQGTTLRDANRIRLTTDISPELTNNDGGGTINISVTDANGQAVALAEVSIVASSLTTPVNTTLLTDSNGELTIPGAEPCAACYEITVTRTGYSTDETYSTDDVTNPTQPHLTVVDGQVTEASFSIDQLGSLTIYSVGSRDQGFPPFANQQFILRGEKIIGTDATGTLIYKYAEVLNTDGTGTLVIDDLEWDAYHIQIPTGVGWDVSGVNPILPIVLNPSEEITATFSSETGSDHRLLVSFQDTSLATIASVSALLKDNSSSFEASSSAGISGDPDFGQIFFSDLAESTYTLYATASGYQTFTSSDVIVTDYAKEEVIMIEE